MDRRKFMKISAVKMAGLGIMGMGASAFGAPVSASTSTSPFAAAKEDDRAGKNKKAAQDGTDGRYSVVVLGDTHYDKAPDSVYHEGYSDPNPKREANHRKEFVRNANMWADRTRRLLRRASELVSDDTKMAIQLGDIIQGDCGNGENHKLMLDDAYCYIKGAIGGVPLITVAGNHDLRGKDDEVATAAYTEYMTERMSRELRQEVTKTCYSFRIGKDAFIAVDFTHPDDEEIERLFRESEGARYTFVIIHGPVLPYQSPTSANWMIHGRDGNDQARRHFRKLLAERDAIVICGHTHTTELARWEGDGGRFVQMTVSSVWSSEAVGKYKLETDKVEDYGAVVYKDGKQQLKDLVDEYKPGMKEFSYAKSCGSYRLNVSDAGVNMEFYAGDSRELTAIFTLR